MISMGIVVGVGKNYPGLLFLENEMLYYNACLILARLFLYFGKESATACNQVRNESLHCLPVAVCPNRFRGPRNGTLFTRAL